VGGSRIGVMVGEKTPRVGRSRDERLVLMRVVSLTRLERGWWALLRNRGEVRKGRFVEGDWASAVGVLRREGVEFRSSPVKDCVGITSQWTERICICIRGC
jgi:hypothetical protein